MSQTDDEMPDAPALQTSAMPEQDDLRINGEPADLIKIRILPGDVPTGASYEFLNEDHTLGNALRYIIMKNPDVEFCGYSIPHPSDPKMNLRIQTYDDVSPHDCLEKGLRDLMDLCDVVYEKFDIARKETPNGSD